MCVPFSTLIGLASATLALLATSCGTINSTPAHPRASHQVLYKWYDDGGEGKVSVRISLPDQIAEFKRGDRDIGWCYVATGKKGHRTRPGSYHITEKIVDKYSNIYGWFEDEFGNVTDNDAKASEKVPPGMVYVPAPMPYWMRLTSYGLGMHGGVIPEPGQPASHGCIRLPKEFAPALFASVNVGTKVTITNSPSQRAEPPADSHAPQQIWTQNSGEGGSVQAVTYRNGVPVSSN